MLCCEPDEPDTPFATEARDIEVASPAKVSAEEMAPLGECLKSERNEFGNLVVAWEEKYDECGTLKANKCILIFEDDELDYTKEFAPDCCGNYPQGTKETRRTPYAQLGSVMKEEDINDCCGKPVNIRALHTDRMRIVPGAQGVPKCCQCDVHEDGLQYEPWVDAMVAALNERKVSRGNIGQMKKAEQQEARIEELHKKMDAIITHLNITYEGGPPAAHEMAR